MRLTLRFVVVLIAMLAMCVLHSAALAALYKYTDDEGVLHIVTSLSEVPAKYRDQVQEMKTDMTPTPGSATPSPAAQPSPETVTQPAVPVDPSGLARFEVPYSNEGDAGRIILPVKFNDSLTALMALDTGSPGLVISFDLAIRLGIFRRDSGTLIFEAGGIGGSVPAILTIVDSVAIEGARDEFIPTTVTFSISPAFEGLIGMDFLSNYTLTVDSRRQVVVFQEMTPSSDARGGHDEAWWRRTFEDFREMSDGWREYVRDAERRSGTRVTPLARFQAQEANRLLQRLHQHASKNSVPQHWR